MFQPGQTVYSTTNIRYADVARGDQLKVLEVYGGPPSTEVDPDATFYLCEKAGGGRRTYIFHDDLSERMPREVE